jgi:glycosyltransferase involved in cell wall biosynthesis
MKFTLIIPSYWGRKSGEPFNEEDAVYDHPTPLDSEGTLARALESVRSLSYDDFRVVVVGAATHPDLEQDMEERLLEIIAPFREGFPVALLSHSNLQEVQGMLKGKGHEEASAILSLSGYSNIRNFCLAAACLTGADAAVLFDDDQVYEDANYLNKVARVIGGEHRGRFVGGLAGYYVNRDGGYRVPENRDWIYSEWPAVSAMNEAFETIESGERLQVTPWVFGGNMVVHSDLYNKVAFDPCVTRGEDIDYLINSRFLGYDFFLDNQLWIRHLPPPKSAPLWRRFREDLDRFIYTREKLRSQEPGNLGSRVVNVDDLEPYPGRFLRDDLDDMIFKTCLLMGLDYLSKGDNEGFSQCMANVRRARFEARPQFDPYIRYMEWRSLWEQCMSILDQSRELREYIMEFFRE